MLPRWILKLFGWKVGLSHSWILPTGYKNPKYQPMPTTKEGLLKRLDEMAHDAIDDFEAKTDSQGTVTTFCNVACDLLAREVWGFRGFVGMLANQMYDRMNKAPDFAEIDADAAQLLANDARMVIAAIKGDDHGHVALVVPGKVVYSSKWMKNAPILCNVGKRNGFMSANWCFITPPKYFAWISDDKETT